MHVLIAQEPCYICNYSGFDSEINMPKQFDRYDYFETMMPYTSIKVTRPFTNNDLRTELVLNYAQDKGKKFYINGGKWDSTAKGRKKIDGTYYLIKGGKWSKTTELYKEGSTYYYIKSGKWSKTTNVVKIGSTSYYIKSGKWSKTTTLYKKSGKYYAIKSGKWTKSKTIIKYNGKKYYVNDGYAQTKYSGKVTISGKKYTVKKGIIK